MKNTPDPIPAPPHDSDPSLEQGDDRLMISGSSRGVPEEASAAGEPAAASKAGDLLEKPFDQSPTAGFRLVESKGGSRVEIEHVQELVFQRLLPFVIGFVIITLMGLTLLGGKGEGTGLLVDLMNMARDHVVWSKVAKGLFIGVISYLIFRVAGIAFGTLRMKVDRHSFEIKKGIFGIGFPRSLSRAEVTGLKQSSWTEKRKDESMDTIKNVRYWKLEIQGEKSITILSDEVNPRDSDWLGQYLAAWFEVPFVKESK